MVLHGAREYQGNLLVVAALLGRLLGKTSVLTGNDRSLAMAASATASTKAQ